MSKKQKEPAPAPLNSLIFITKYMSTKPSDFLTPSHLLETGSELRGAFDPSNFRRPADIHLYPAHLELLHIARLKRNYLLPGISVPSMFAQHEGVRTSVS